MKILALDSSGLVASVAIVEDENLIAEYTMNYKNTFADLNAYASGSKQNGRT